MAQLDDDQLDNELRFERYERERRRQDAAKKTATINVSDEKQSSEQMGGGLGIRGSQPDITQEETLKEDQLQEPVHARQQHQETPRLVEPVKKEEPVRPTEPQPEQQNEQPQPTKLQ